MSAINAKGGRITCEDFVTEYLNDFNKIKGAEKLAKRILENGELMFSIPLLLMIALSVGMKSY